MAIDIARVSIASGCCGLMEAALDTALAYAAHRKMFKGVNLDLDGINLVNRMVQAHLRSGGAALITTHGAYAAPPVRTRMLQLGAAA